jgi:hypothetical protein
MDCDSYVSVGMTGFDWAHRLMGWLSIADGRFVVTVDSDRELWWWLTGMDVAVAEEKSEGGKDTEQFGSVRG